MLIELKRQPKPRTLAEREFLQTIERIRDLDRQLNICEENLIDELAHELIAENVKLKRIKAELTA